MKLNVYIKDKKYVIEVGDASQSLKWLADVANFRLKRDSPHSSASPTIIRLENGDLLELEGTIKENFLQDQNIWVILDDEFENQ